MMCDSSGEKTIEVTCELYLQRYFFKGSKVCGNIYVNGEKYISNYDLEQYERFWTYADDGFSAKLDGKKYIGTFLKEDHWTNTDDGRRRDLFRGEQSIQQVLLFPEEKIIAFRLYDDKGENTLYLGPAGNAAEYKEAERKCCVRLLLYGSEPRRYSAAAHAIRAVPAVFNH